MLAVVLLTLAACSDGGSGETTTTPIALVTLARVERRALADRVTLYGVAESGATGRFALTAPVEALVMQIVAPVGTQVRKGEIIVQLSAAPSARLDIVKASTDARVADAAYARARRLRGDGLVGDAEVETARAAAAAADATRVSLAGRAAGLTLRAPAPGFVESVPVGLGDVVQPGTMVATIARAGDLRARFGADPTTARALRAGTPVRIEASAGRGALILPIASIAPLVDPATRLASVFVRVPAAAGVSVGETLEGAVAVGVADDALTIPYAALLDDAGQPYVFVVADRVAHRRDVAVGAIERGRVAILRGIRAGEEVVTDGGTAVEDGMKVRTR